MHGTRAAPAAGPGAASAPVGPACPPLGRGLQVLALAAGSAAVLVAAGLIAWTLALARMPQHRAALEELIHSQTGLEVRFSELGLRWGWYGPEAVFRGVELAEPGAAGVLLRAPTLLVDFDAWRTLRSGALTAARITLENPAIDLADHPNFVHTARSGTGPAGAAHADAVRAGAAPHEAALTAGARILSNWRGARVDIEGGTLRVPAAGGAGSPLELVIRRVTLRRMGARVTADATVLLPQSLGAAAHARLDLVTDPNAARIPSATLELDAERLDFAGWRAALEALAPADAVPLAGSGNLTLRVRLDRGRVVSAGGTLAAEGLAWQAIAAHTAGLKLERLRGAWRLMRTAGGWHLTADRLELAAGTGGTGPAAAPIAAELMVDAAPDAAWVRGRVRHAPAAALAELARALAPAPELWGTRLAGLVREASFDFNAHRPPGARLRTAAEIDDLELRTPDGDAALAGLAVSVEGEDERLRVALSAPDARLTLARPPAITVAGVRVGAHLALEADTRGWQLSSRDLRVDAGALALRIAGAVSATPTGGHPRIDAQARLTGADVVLLQRLLGTAPFAALGAAPGELAAGRIDNADIEVHGPLDEALPWRRAGARFAGSLELHGATLIDPQLWPDIRGLDAQVAWRGADVRAVVTGAEAGTFSLESGAIEWNRHTVHFSGRVTGAAQEALAWLRGHPELRQYAPRLESLDMRGNTLVDFDVRMPALTARAAGAHAAHARFAAVLDGMRLRPVEGLPPIDALRGTLAASDGHLQRSTLTGTWLGGPVALTVGERRTTAGAALAVSGHGLLNVNRVLIAASAAPAGLEAVTGTAEWSADFRQLPAAGGAALRWRARLDSSLVGLGSRLPEPLAKTPATALPLHVELSGNDAAGELRLALGERLHAVAALVRQGELWQVARGALSLGASQPELPSAPVMLLSGTVSRVDLPACVALWRGLAHSPGWPALHAEVAAGELLALGAAYRDVSVIADSIGGADTLTVDSPGLSGEAHWSGAAGPATLSIRDLKWQGRPVGRLTARLTVHGGSSLDVADIHLSGVSDEAQGTLHCKAGACDLKFNLQSTDTAATLASFGLRGDVSAARGRLEGELGWQPQGPLPALATATGRLHIQLEDGTTRTAAAAEAAPADEPLALLVVPALVAGSGSPELRFASLSADFTLRDGQALTSDLHFDGDAEILMRGRVGLLARDYDGRLWVFKGGERLPAALRGLTPAPRIAALWLSLRSLITGGAADRTHSVLTLRGSWDEPLVTASE